MYNHYLIRWHLFWVSQVVLSNELEGREQLTSILLNCRNLSYTDYIKIKGFPLFKLAYKGGIIVEQKTVRTMVNSERTIMKENPAGTYDGKGIEWAQENI
jgi:cell division protein FtsI (penicillin-binding protein 3)